MFLSINRSERKKNPGLARAMENGETIPRPDTDTAMGSFVPTVLF